MERINQLRGAIRRLFWADPSPGRAPGPDGPFLSTPALFAPSIESEAPSGYSRFSLSLVRHPPELPYTGARVVERTADVVPFLHRLLDFEPSECMGALFLSARNHPIGHAIPFRGTLTGCRVEPRQLLLMALGANAAAMVLFHQHPSGDPSPSPEDRAFARRLGTSADVVGVALRDFALLGEPPVYWSMRDGGPIGLPAGRPERLRRRKRRKPKYRHPDDPEATWVGTGFMPVWLREEIEGGASLEDFLVDGAEVTPGAARQEQRVRERAGVASEGGR